MSVDIKLGEIYRRTGADAGKQVFIPDHYVFDSTAEMLNFIEQHPLAQILTTDQQGFKASATPLIQVGEPNELEFIGHIAKRNPQAKSILNGIDVMALFNGPNAYVSPRWFKINNTVPTWNYLSIQLRGTFEVITEPQELFKVLRLTIEHMEQLTGGEPWVLEQAPQELVNRLAKMIVAFKFHGTSIEGVKRLAQDKDVTDIRNIQHHLQHSCQSGAQDIASLMQRYCVTS